MPSFGLCRSMPRCCFFADRTSGRCEEIVAKDLSPGPFCSGSTRACFMGTAIGYDRPDAMLWRIALTWPFMAGWTLLEKLNYVFSFSKKAHGSSAVPRIQGLAFAYIPVVCNYLFGREL